ncbi:MAG: hypothetical protein COB73_08540 [Flavobacteriaceae bacterium]|nr:MAG: hypothetical protein COB73_08540 [Flavobacteriaceae bacterium]
MTKDKLITYKISEDNLLLKKQQGLTPQVVDVLTDIFDDVVKGKKKMIPKLIKLSLKYPKVPQFKNNLATVYQVQGNIIKAYETNKWIVAEHPNYLFGKLNLANEYIYKGNFDKVLEVMGEMMEISELYPDRDEFHIDEVISFNATAINYFLGIDDLEQAQIRLDIMIEVDPENPKTQQAFNLIMAHKLSGAPDFFTKQWEEMIEVSVPNLKASIQTTKPPIFHFPKQINYLYTNGTDISTELVDELLALDPEKLSEDLTAIINDSIVRFDHYNDNVEIDGWKEENFSFLTHALILLSELKNPKTLESVLSIVRQDEEYFEFWFGDLVQENLGYVIHELAKEQLPVILNFLKEPNIYCYVKSVVAEATIAIASYNPEREFQITSFCDNLLSYYIDNNKDEGLVDTDFYGFFISDLIDLRAKTLLPKIEQMFNLNIVGYWICGDYESVKEEIFSDSTNDFFSFDCTLSQKYNRINEFGKFSDEDLFEEEEEEDFYFPPSIVPFIADKKTGRNEPCPCGSGKKYKKCCINK